MKNFTTENTGLVLDSDRAMTKGSFPNPDGGERLDITSYSFLKDVPDLDSHFFEEMEKLYTHYCLGIERNKHFPKDRKPEKMKEWGMKMNYLYQEYMTQDMFNEAMKSFAGKLEMREGVPEFLEFFLNHNMPALIYSAGVADVIDAVLEHNGFGGTDLMVHGNKFHFDEDGNFIVPEEKDVIATGEKTWANLPEAKQVSFQDRTHMIIGGDSEEDLLMGDNSKVLHNVGFLLQANEKPENFRQLFDRVIESEECDRGEFAKITQEILRNS